MIELYHENHYTPLQYRDILLKFDKKCHEGYEILRHTINLCYVSEMSLREYWFKVFDENFITYSDFMDEEARQAYSNIYCEAKRKYLEEMIEDG